LSGRTKKGGLGRKEERPASHLGIREGALAAAGKKKPGDEGTGKGKTRDIILVKVRRDGAHVRRSRRKERGDVVDVYRVQKTE